MNDFILALCLFAVSALGAETIDRQSAPQAEVRGKAAFRLAFAPDYVACDIPRRFMVELEFPGTFVPTEVKTGDAVRMIGVRDLVSQLDKRPERKLRRYYFETVKPANPETILIRDRHGKVEIPVVVWGYEDLRKQRVINGMKFPRRFPVWQSISCTKTGSVLPPPRQRVTDPMPIGGFAAARMNWRTPVPVKEFTLEEVWNMAPDTSFTVRKNFPGPPDPVHGQKVYSSGNNAFYSYVIPPKLPGKKDRYTAISPVDGKEWPDNDYLAGKFDGTIVDDGINGAEYSGGRNYFIGQIAVMRALQLYDLVYNSARLYAHTKNPHYANIALTGLCRIGLESNLLATMAHYRRSHILIEPNRRLTDSVPFAMLGNTGVFFDGIWTTEFTGLLAYAYDYVFPAVVKDSEMIAFLKKQGLPVHSAEDLKRFIEENVFLTYIQGHFDRQNLANFPKVQNTVLGIINVLDYPSTAFQPFLNTVDENLFFGTFGRDGVKVESPGGYNRNGISLLLSVFDRVGEYYERHPEVFPASRYPRPNKNRRFLTAAESMVKHATTPFTSLAIGDGDKMPGYKCYYDGGKTFPARGTRSFSGDESPAFLSRIYSDFHSPEAAWALLHTDRFQIPPNAGYTRADLEKSAASLPENWRERAELLSGPGVTILRGGRGDQERSLYLHYGSVVHGHDSAMGLFLDAFGSRLMTHWGYPVKLDRWYYNWMIQNTGRSFPVLPGAELTGQNELCLTSGNISLSSSRAFAVTANPAAAPGKSAFTTHRDVEQSRMNLLVNSDGDHFYVVDFYRMLGGTKHVRSFHTLDGTAAVSGLKLSPQQGGTLAGKEIPYGDRNYVNANGGIANALGFVRVTDVERGKADRPFETVWDINRSSGLKIRLISLLPGNMEVALGTAGDFNKNHPVTRRMLFTTHPVKPGEWSQTVNLLECYRETPAIQKYEFISLNGKQDAVAFAVKLETRTDYFILADSPGKRSIDIGRGVRMELDGRAGVVSADSQTGKVLRMHLFAGKNLKFGSRSWTAEDAWRGSIVSMNPEEWSLEALPACAEPEKLAGRILYVTRGDRVVPLEIKSARNRGGSTVVMLNNSPLLNRLAVEAHADGRLFSRKPAAAPGNRPEPRVMGQKWYSTVLRGKSGRIYLWDSTGVTGTYYLLGEPSRVAADVLAREFPAGETVSVYDYAPGMRFEVPLSSMRNLN